MQGFITICFAVFFWAFLGCRDENLYQNGTKQAQDVADRSQETLSTEQLQGECPNIFFESTKQLSNGAEVTWTSSFGGFDYEKGTPYTVTVTWKTMGASATFVDFAERNKVWTPPKDVNKGAEATTRWSTNNRTDSSLDLTVKMEPMHRAIDPDWQGYIGNGHFKLELSVDGIMVKLGINVHLEDPDDGFNHRCPGD